MRNESGEAIEGMNGKRMRNECTGVIGTPGPSGPTIQASEVNGNVGHLLFVVDGCGRSFTSATGLGQYMRHQHPIVHNEKFAGVKRTRWKDDELRRVAHFETECGDLVNVNQYIASKLPGRTGEAVKKVRKRHDYLEILEDVRRRATDGRANLVSPPNKRFRYHRALKCNRGNGAN